VKGAPRRVPQNILDAIVRLRGEGSTYPGIADLLNRQGVPTATGARWDKATVRYLYTRETPAPGPHVPVQRRPGRPRGVPQEVIDTIVTHRSRYATNRQVAMFLNNSGFRTAAGERWTTAKVRYLYNRETGRRG
jgi:Recombinase